jgi:uracil-DNA glycosylase family 4
MKYSSNVRHFDIDCRQCSRLSDFLDDVKEKHPEYHARPVPPFGDANAKLIIVGLAPGMHGANATGRPFTGDYAGVLLYETLYKFGFGSKPQSLSAKDDLELTNCRITNAVKCLPPQNKPTGSEINICNQFLKEELADAAESTIVIALGLVAHNAVLKALGEKISQYKFGHGALHKVGSLTLLDSYHCSRYNTQTKRLTEKMFHDVFKKAKQLLANGKK